MSRLDPTSLQLFISVAEAGTIAGAAERAHIATASVSKRISELEAALRTPLLMRTNKGVEPTAAGIALLTLARRALHELDQIPVQMQSYASGVRGIVRVVASMSAITQFLPDEIKSFLSQHPDVQVQLEERVSSVIPKAVAENAADVGIFTAAHRQQHLEILPYHSDRLVLITPKEHPLAGRESLSFAETLDYDYVGLHTGSAINLQLVRAANEAERPINLRIQVTSYDALCLMVNSGLGIGMLPRAIAEHHSKMVNVRIIALSEPWAERHFKICVRSLETLPSAARLLVNHLQESARRAAALSA
jgi:DNA-binding transcriptional LysR family regulator